MWSSSERSALPDLWDLYDSKPGRLQRSVRFMFGFKRKPRAADQNRDFITDEPSGVRLSCNQAQAGSPSGCPHSRVLLKAFVVTTALVLWGLLASGCASRGMQGEHAAANTESSKPSTPLTIDAIHQSGDGWRVFQLGARREAFVRIPTRGAPESLPWKMLATPSGIFRPVHIVWGQRGYFYVVDAASARLCLYDENAALLSTHPLPPEFTPFPAGRAAVFRGADGAFTFVDYGAGEAWQFADRLTIDAGATRWLPRGRVKLPAGTRECVQPSGSSNLYCKDAAGAPLRFDGALNRVGLRVAGDDVVPEISPLTSAAAADATLRVRWEAQASAADAGWVFEAVNTSAPDSVVFRYDPQMRNWTFPEASAPGL